MKGFLRIGGAILAAASASWLAYSAVRLLLATFLALGPEAASDLASFAFPPPFFGVLYTILLPKRGEWPGQAGGRSMGLALLAGYAALVVIVLLGLAVEPWIGETSAAAGIAGWAAYGYVAHRLWPRRRGEGWRLTWE
jgi:hypothetical protein